jgi:hypothetical protein
MMRKRVNKEGEEGEGSDSGLVPKASLQLVDDGAE